MRQTVVAVFEDDRSTLYDGKSESRSVPCDYTIRIRINGRIA